MTILYTSKDDPSTSFYARCKVHVWPKNGATIWLTSDRMEALQRFKEANPELNYGHTSSPNTSVLVQTREDPFVTLRGATRRAGFTTTRESLVDAEREANLTALAWARSHVLCQEDLLHHALLVRSLCQDTGRSKKIWWRYDDRPTVRIEDRYFRINYARGIVAALYQSPGSTSWNDLALGIMNDCEEAREAIQSHERSWSSTGECMAGGSESYDP